MLKVPNYTITEKIWEGANTIIYRGYRDADKSPVMLKVPKSEHPTAKVIARFEQEHNLLKTLDDKNIIRTFGIERVQHSVVLITDDFGASSLRTLLGSQQLDTETKLSLALSLAHALEFLRREHVLHKDIKPANIAYNAATGELKLIDFGFATRLDREVQRFVRPDALEGTLAYISPEQTGRMNRDIDHRSDLYSVGITLYEIFTGELPFQTNDALAMVHRHIARVPDSPHQRNADVPEAVSRIIMKLISKEPEARYQTAQGLVADIKLCLDQWKESGRIQPFELGRHDVDDTLRIPQKLYGREAETDVLLSAFERARQNAPVVMLISGPAGVGKSVLVHEVYRLIARHGGEFLSGKFDQLHRGLPFASFTQAFRELVRQLLTEPPESLDVWREKLLSALGSSGQVLTDVLPELERVIGRQPPVAPLTPSESQNRFGLVFQRFVEVFCTPGHPLVVFLDDLQWADSGSLWLLQYLPRNLRSAPLLLVGAYRDHEVDEAHPLMSTLREMRGEGIEPVELQLGNIDQTSTRRLLADSLPGAEGVRIDALAEQLFMKTQGSPLFLTRVLLEWYKDGLIHVDRATNRWTWDDAAVTKATVPGNVAEFLAKKLKTFGASTQSLISLAACIGFQFDLHTLTIIANRSTAEVTAAFWPVLQSGLIIPLDGDYRLVFSPDGAPSNVSGTHDLQVTFRFLHDRVQQAAYSLINEQERQDVHLRIGRRLRERLADPPDVESLFDVVNHMNAGARSISDERERTDLARLDFLAAKAAKSATAFGAAVNFLDAGTAVLDEACWSTHYELAFGLHRELVECLYMARELNRGDAEIERLFARSQRRRDSAGLYALQAFLNFTRSRVVESMAAGRKGLELFGITLPDAFPEVMAAYGAEVGAIDEWMQSHSLDSLLDAPMMGPDEQLIAQLLGALVFPAFWLNPPLFAVLTAKQVSLALKHGLADSSTSGFAEYGLTLSGILGRVADAIKFGEIGLKIGEKLRVPSELANALNFVGAFSTCGKPYHVCAEFAKRAVNLAVEAGNVVVASNAAYQRSALVYATGEPLDRVQQDIDQGLAVIQWSREKTTLGGMMFLRQTIACLQGRTHAHLSMSDDTFEEHARVAYEESMNNKTIVFVYHLSRLELAVWFGAPETAMEKALDCEQVATGGLGTFNMPNTINYGALVLTARYMSAPPEEQQRITEVLGRVRPRVEAFAAGCPENYQSISCILAAEMARINGDISAAHQLYDEAVEAAQTHGLIQYEALANELCGRMYHAMKRKKVARAYLLDARSAYERWGAHGKVRHLDELYPGLASAVTWVSPAHSSVNELHSRSISTTSSSSHALDVPTIIKASQALSGEISFDRLMMRMMSVVAENAGAEKGALILTTNNEHRVSAEVAIHSNVTILSDPVPLRNYQGVCQGIVHYVHRTHETVVLDDAALNGLFTKDPDVILRKPRSILCIPLLHQGQLKGILYLENNLTAGTFTVERTTLLNAICSQMAISIENAHVYANLERLVEERTRELRAAQARVVKLEKQATEVRMAGGFAHEMRNALASAQIRLQVVYKKQGDSEFSLLNECGTELEKLVLLAKEHMSDNEFQQTLSSFRRIYEIQTKIQTALSGMTTDMTRALRVTGRILDYSRQGFETPGDFPINLRTVVDSVIRSAEQRSPNGRLAVDIDIAPECIVPGSEPHFFSMLSNLLFNAQDAVSDTADLRTPTISIKAYQSRDAVAIEVKDNGIGIAPENMPKIFEPFYSTKPNSGTGLGLSMVEKLVSLYNGTIDVTSERNVGTTVTVRLPVVTA